MLIDYQNVSIYQADKCVLQNINFHIDEGEFAYLIGKVGSGKSSLLKTLYCELDLVEGETEKAEILGRDLKTIRRKEIPALRKELGIIFQDFQLLHDRTVRKNFEFVLKATGWKNKKDREKRIEEVLNEVGMIDKIDKMPHELSGGEQQRVAIARAILNNPKIIIADEPTTALDVTIQAQILKLMDKLVKEQDASLILITHDLAVVSQMADRIIVMYCGKIVESGSRDDVIRRPSHPYTEGLLNSIPRMGEEQKRLESIPGMVPSMLDLPQGCYFAPRCKYCQDICRTVAPESHEVGPGHCAVCHFPLTGGESHE